VITACTVLYQSNTSCLTVWLESMAMNAKLVSEVLIADVNPTKKPAEILAMCGGFNARILPIKCIPLDGHALGLHECINNAKNEMLLISDNDVFHYMPGFDRFMLDVHTKNNLLFTGVCHWVHLQAFGSFPSVITFLVKKSDLPPPEFLAGKLKLDKSGWTHMIRIRPGFREKNGWDADGHWLLCGPVSGETSKFPHSHRMFDVGNNLYLWARERRGKWLSFLNRKNKSRVYTTKNSNNFDLNDDFGNQLLLYHQARGNRPHWASRAPMWLKKAWTSFRTESQQHSTGP
jgi:hypothetical protein